MLTEIGKFLRKLRIDNREILSDMAFKLGVTASYLSAVENGKKKFPMNWGERIVFLYKLNYVQEEELFQAVAETEQKCQIEFCGIDVEKRQTAVSFARKFADLSDEQMEQIRQILMEINNDN